MTKEEVLLHLRGGKKVTHKVFTEKTWIEQVSKSHYKDDLDNVHTIKTFWKMRTGKVWNNGWELYKLN